MKFESLRYTADFETITEYEKDNNGNFILKEDSNGELRKVPKRCRVWAWAWKRYTAFAIYAIMANTMS